MSRGKDPVKLPEHEMRLGDVVYYRGSLPDNHGIYVVGKIDEDTYYRDHVDPEIQAAASTDGKTYLLQDKEYPDRYLYRVRRQSFVYLEFNQND